MPTDTSSRNWYRSLSTDCAGDRYVCRTRAFPVGDEVLNSVSDDYPGHLMSELLSAEDPAITLYRLQACPFCERVVRTLDDHDLRYRSRFVEPRHSERDVVKRISGKRSVPAIVDENTGVTMSESENIVDYLEKTYGRGT